MFFAVMLASGFRLREDAATIAQELLSWSALGLWVNSPVNGLAHAGDFLANVVWSLRWEWFFYASLIVTAPLARFRLGGWLTPTLGLTVALSMLAAQGHWVQGGQRAALVALFCVGMSAAAFRRAVWTIDFEAPIFSGLALAAASSVFWVGDTIYAVVPIVLLATAFFIVANGGTLFGVLMTRSARRLGDISFGIYLLHGLVLAAVFSTAPVRALAESSPWTHWALVGFGAMVSVCLSAIVHVIIEQPAITIGRRVGRSMEAMAGTLTRSRSPLFSDSISPPVPQGATTTLVNGLARDLIPDNIRVGD
jgi:peptidoglycan/LPS O-acetylase OafA/YrhL